MEMMDMAADDTREELRRKLRSNFDGRIVRKDLTKKIKDGANVPGYVLEFLLGQYCSSDDETMSARMRLRKFSPSCARTGAIPLLIW